MNVSISILTHNRSQILRELLESLSRISDHLNEIIVIDNNSDDETPSMVAEQFPQVHYYRMESNIGITARNVGIKNASGDIVITLDDDVLGIDSCALIRLANIFGSRPDIGAVCFKVRDYYTGEICNWCHHYIKEEYCDREFYTDEISEGAVAFRKEALDKSGLYPKEFFISYEGADLFCRLLDAGYKNLYCPDIIVQHKHASQARPNWRRYYYDTRNQIWFVVRNLPVLFGLRYLIRGLGAMFIYSLRDGFSKFWFKGVWDALLGLPLILNQRKPLSKVSMRFIREIAAHRPGTLYMIKLRLFRKGVSI